MHAMPLRPRWIIMTAAVTVLLLSLGDHPCAAQDTVVPVPPGYYEVFRSDFSQTTITPYVGGNQWYFKLSGGEFGYSWQYIPALTGASSNPLRVQTLVGASAILDDFMQTAIVNEGFPQGQVLRFTDLKDDPDFISISRDQIFGPLAPSLNKLFYEFKFKLPLATANAFKDNSRWWDFSEAHNNVGPNGHSYRLSFHLTVNNPLSQSQFQVTVRDDTTATLLWSEITAIEDIWGLEAGTYAWDTWHTFTAQWEATGSGDDQGFVKAWIDGRLICDRKNCPLGFPWNNFHVFKSYVDDNILTGAPINFFMDDLKIFISQSSTATPTPITTFASTINRSFYAYPNPARQQVHFFVASQEQGEIKIMIYNAAGERVALLSTQAAAAGSVILTWDCSSMPPGIYFAGLMQAKKIRWTKVALIH